MRPCYGAVLQSMALRVVITTEKPNPQDALAQGSSHFSVAAKNSNISSVEKSSKCKEVAADGTVQHKMYSWQVKTKSGGAERSGICHVEYNCECSFRMLIDAIDCAHSRCEFMWKTEMPLDGKRIQMQSFSLYEENSQFKCTKNLNLENAMKHENTFLRHYCSALHTTATKTSSY